MPPPQCPECGRFLATAFVRQLSTAPAPCPGCGAELSLEPPAADGDDATPTSSPPAGDLEQASGGGNEDMAAPDDEADEADEAEVDDAAAQEGPPLPPTGAVAEPADVEPEHMTSVRPPDTVPDPDPLAGWDESGTFPPPPPAPDPTVLAVGAGAGLLLGLLLGGRRHRALGALLGALLGAVTARLRG